jgi:hypothetical protein
MINEQIVEQIQDRVACHNKRRNGKLTFTVEPGRGETYVTSDLTVYAHDDYDESSVLSGQERRMWIGSFYGQSRQDAEDTVRAAGTWRITEFLGGSTHVSVDQMVAHLPDDTDY